ncbi:MAG TPA: hypothetical protein VIV35_02715 [Chitinophagaceae bacterium]
MKNKHLVHANQSAKIYRHYYKSSFNIFRLLKSVLSIFISGTSHVATPHHRRK